MARALSGDINPGGKLPVTWPRTVGQVPLYYAHNRSHWPQDQDRRYADLPSTPQFVFGHGLSYTSFSISAPDVGSGTLEGGGRLIVSTTVCNTGQRAGDEVVQLYIHQQAGRASRPVRELKGFQRVSTATTKVCLVAHVAELLLQRKLKARSATDQVAHPAVQNAGGCTRARQIRASRPVLRSSPRLGEADHPGKRGA